MAPGVPDEAFVRGKVPMTKEEIRCIALSKLRLGETSVAYDIGAGTGSVAVEALYVYLLRPRVCGGKEPGRA